MNAQGNPGRAGAASLTGRIPCWGNHRTENRIGTRYVDVRTPVAGPLDWGMRGYFAGGRVQPGLPVWRPRGRRSLPEAGRRQRHGVRSRAALAGPVR